MTSVAFAGGTSAAPWSDDRAIADEAKPAEGKVLFEPVTETASVFPGKDWEEATPESQGVDSAQLKAAAQYLDTHTGRDGAKELVVIRNGRMIWRGPNIDKRHGIWSATKSFTSTILGLLIEDGKCTLDTRAKDYVREMAEYYPEVTLRHFTTMTSGYQAKGDQPAVSHGQSATPFEPDRPLFSPPGSKYAYWDSAINEFALVLTRIAGEPIEELFQRQIADPIGMNRAQWDWGDIGKVDGLVVNCGAGNRTRVEISARELARLGLLFLNRGDWNGWQLISARWVKTATSVQVPASTPLGHKIDGRGMYGFNWWVNGIKADGQRKWPGAPTGTFAASGHNNNDMFVIPEWNMVIVRLGLDGKDLDVPDTTYSDFLQAVGKAIRK